MMNSNALFSMALGLSAPWQITDVDFKANDPARRELHLQIGFTLGTAYRLKALFNDLCTMPDKPAANVFLNAGCDRVEEAKIPAFQKFANTVKIH